MGWIILILIVIVFLIPPLGILVIGMGKKYYKSWKIAFTLTAIIYALSLYMKSEYESEYWQKLFFLNWLFSLLYLGYLFFFVDDEPPKITLPEIKPRPPRKTPPPMATKPKTEEEKFMADMRKWRSEVESADMKNHIDNIIKFSDLVQKKDKETGLKFIKRYGTPLNSLLHKYDEIENTGLKSEELKNAMSSMEKSLGVIAEALEKEVISLYKTDVLHMDAETSAFIQSLKSRGLIEE